MQMIVYPGATNQPCQAEYRVAIRRDAAGVRTDIVVIDSHRGETQHTPLIYAPAGLDLVLNKILSTDLQGIRIDLVRFYVIIDTESANGMTGYEYGITIDFEDYQRNGNPVTVSEVRPATLKGWLRYLLGFYVQTATVLKRDVVGGRATAKAGHVRMITDDELSALVTAVGYETAGPAPSVRLGIIGLEKSWSEKMTVKPTKTLH